MDGRGYKSDVYGGTLGVDGSANGFTVGAALTISTGDTDSTNTLVNSTTDSDFVGLSVYGSKASGDLNVTADLGYLHGANDVSVKSYQRLLRRHRRLHAGCSRRILDRNR